MSHLLLKKLMQLLFAVVEAPLVGRVDDPDEAVGGLEVVSPVAPKALLSADVPNVESESAMLQRLDVESQSGRNGRNVLAVELFQDRRFAGVVEAPKRR